MPLESKQYPPLQHCGHHEILKRADGHWCKSDCQREQGPISKRNLAHKAPCRHRMTRRPSFLPSTLYSPHCYLLLVSACSACYAELLFEACFGLVCTCNGGREWKCTQQRDAIFHSLLLPTHALSQFKPIESMVPRPGSWCCQNTSIGACETISTMLETLVLDTFCPVGIVSNLNFFTRNVCV